LGGQRVPKALARVITLVDLWSMSDWFRGLGTLITTVFVFVILIWWLVIVARYVGVAPSLDSTGKVTLDKFGNAKGILLVVFPLATTCIGYWFGNQGTNQANANADKAQGAADSAKAQLSAVLDAAPAGTLATAKQMHKEVFATPGGSSGDPTPGAEAK
jgi:hypothetical protein